jgi:hypothetical protein
MDPVDEFRDLCVSDAAATRACVPLFREADIQREVRAARPKVVVVYGRAGSGRSHVADVARRAMDARYVEVDETYAHSVNVTLTRRALDKHIAAASTRRVYVLLAKYDRASPHVLTLHTVDYIDECAMRDRYGVGIQRFLRNYGGSVVQMHNHRAFGIEPATHRFAPALLEPRTSLLVERMFRGQRGDPEPFAFADALVARYERDEEELPELVVEVLASMLRKRQPERVRGAVGPRRASANLKQPERDDEPADVESGDVARDEQRDVVGQPELARDEGHAPVRGATKKKVDRGHH